MSPRGAAARAWLLDGGASCRVKLCGLSRVQDVQAANECLPDMVGFICDFPKSHRSVSAERMGELAAGVSERIYTVAVSVDLPLECVTANGETRVDIIQLHGHEDAAYIEALRQRTSAGIIQAFRIRERADVERALASAADMVLLDAGQGCGQTFDWSLADGFGARRPFILAGGLGPDNVAEAVRALRPWGVDMSSGIEHGQLKDPSKMAAAVAAVRSAS